MFTAQTKTGNKLLYHADNLRFCFPRGFTVIIISKVAGHSSRTMIPKIDLGFQHTGRYLILNTNAFNTLVRSTKKITISSTNTTVCCEVFGYCTVDCGYLITSSANTRISKCDGRINIERQRLFWGFLDFHLKGP